MPRARIQHSVKIPDPLRLSRYRKEPDLGPRILFFSGGTALTGLSRTLKNYTHNSTHLVTPFDSGGSSAELRRAFNMPAIGDLRARLLALADETVLSHREITRLFSYRLPYEQDQATLREELNSLVRGESPLMAEVTSPVRDLIRNYLGDFLRAMPKSFDLRGASIGNIILTGAYLDHQQDLDSILCLFSELIHVQGTVRAIINDSLHLGAELEDGSEIIGQHLLTAKEVEPLSSPIRELFLSRAADKRVDARVELGEQNRQLIESADLICFPPGSFYTSVLANILPAGVGRAVARNPNPKVYIPNPTPDPEQAGRSFPELLQKLLHALQQDCNDRTPVEDLLNFILVDRTHDHYPEGLDRVRLGESGIKIIDTPLISKSSAPYYDNELLVSALLSLT